MEGQTESELRQKAEELDVPYTEVEEAFNEELTTFRENALEDLSDAQLERMALQAMTVADIAEEQTAFGTPMDLQVLAIGARSMRWKDGNGGKKPVVLAYGLIHSPNQRLPTRDDGAGPDVGLAVFVLDSAKGVDPSHAMRKFSSRNTVTGRFSVSAAEEPAEVGDTAVYRCEATKRTAIEDADPEAMDLPTDPDDINQVLRARIPQATLADAATDIANVVSSYDPETGYAHEFGVDLRRIEGAVVDYYIADDSSWGRYTILDDTVMEDELPETNLMDDESRTPGLTAWSDPHHHINYGRKSHCDFYGYLEVTDDGQVQMNVVGVVPIIPMPMDDADGSGTTDVNAEEEAI